MIFFSLILPGTAAGFLGEGGVFLALFLLQPQGPAPGETLLLDGAQPEASLGQS